MKAMLGRGLPFTISKQPTMKARTQVWARLLAVALSLVFAGLVLLIFGLDPLKVFPAMIDGAVCTQLRFQQTVIRAIPLVITSLGILVAFKMKFWNIGGEGQIVMGALGAAFVALNFPTLPSWLLLTTMAGASIICGAAWALIPAAFKAWLGTNETIFTLMMNYIAIKFVMYLQYGPWRDPSVQGFPKIPIFEKAALLPKVFGIHIGWIIALILVVAVYLFMNYTKKGFEVSVVGESKDTARYAGMNIPAIIFVAMTISGGLCGLVGMIQASAVERTLTYSISAGYGFTAIITAWLSRLNALVVLLVCFAFAVMLKGADFLQMEMKVPSSVAEIVQGAILLFVLGSEFFLTYRVSLKGRQAHV
jgi:simple sugar transport system permease protein